MFDLHLEVPPVLLRKLSIAFTLVREVTLAMAMAMIIMCVQVEQQAQQLMWLILSGSLDVYLRVNYPTVKSIKTFVGLTCCSSCTEYPDFRRRIKVELYQCPDAVGLIGTVFYAHIASPQVSDNTIYNLTSSSKKLGTAPAPGGCGCYGGYHSHMERSGGATLSGICCATSVLSSTNIYSWTFTPISPCPSAPVK